MTWPFEVVGEIPGPWDGDMNAYLDAAQAHPWGGGGPDRLVVAPIAEGSLTSAIEKYMTPQEFEAWWSTLGPEPRILAKTFRGADGAVTTVVLELPFRDVFLYGFAHQVLEAAGLHRQQQEQYTAPTDPDVSNAHVLWRHYVVERARRELTDRVGIDLGDFDNTELVSEAHDVENALTEAARASAQIGPAQFGPWMMMLRVWAAALGCADAGAVPYALEIRRFSEQPFIKATEDAWEQGGDALHRIWSQPERSTAEHDTSARTDVWEPAHRALVDVWSELTQT